MILTWCEVAFPNESTVNVVTGSKSTSVYLPGDTEPIHHAPQLWHIPLQQADQHFFLPTMSQVISSGLLRDSRQAAISLPVSLFVCQSVVFRVSHNKDGPPCPSSAPRAAFGRGERSGVQCLHHQHSGALCTLWSRITELLSNREQHKLWRECSGRYSDRTCVWVYVCIWVVFY